MTTSLQWSHWVSSTTPAPNTHMAWATRVNTMTPVTCAACQMGTHSRCVFVVAKSSAVLSCALMEGSAPLSNRAFTAFVRPFWAASIRGVLQGRGPARRRRSPSTESRLVPTINKESAQVACPHTDSTIGHRPDEAHCKHTNEHYRHTPQCV